MNGKLDKKTKSITLIVIVVLAGIAGVAGFVMEKSPSHGERYYWNNPGGPVMFEHRAHFEMSDACENCHHEVIRGDVERDCSECHGEDFDAKDFDHADLMAIESHECGLCHLKDESMPIQNCRECHPKTQDEENRIVACPECHSDEYTEDTITHDEMLAIEGHTCDACHVVRSAADVYHEQCDRCHARENPKLFVDENGNSRCNVCHLK
ncbi:MAG: cytochrome c3 family protein [Candidatus Zixiibacteriota bacterium]